MMGSVLLNKIFGNEKHCDEIVATFLALFASNPFAPFAHLSFEDLVSKIKAADLTRISASMKEENSRLKESIMDDWRRVFHRMFVDKKPGDFGDTEMEWEEGMRKHYMIEPGQCGKGGDDKHTVDLGGVLM